MNVRSLQINGAFQLGFHNFKKHGASETAVIQKSAQSELSTRLWIFFGKKKSAEVNKKLSIPLSRFLLLFGLKIKNHKCFAPQKMYTWLSKTIIIIIKPISVVVNLKLKIMSDQISMTLKKRLKRIHTTNPPQ